jgi:hypothetical protein
MLAFLGMSGLVRVNLPCSDKTGLTRHGISRMQNTMVITNMIFEERMILLLSPSSSFFGLNFSED